MKNIEFQGENFISISLTCTVSFFFAKVLVYGVLILMHNLVATLIGSNGVLIPGEVCT